MKQSRLIALLAFIALVCGIAMLMIGPPSTLDVRLFYSNEEAYKWLASLTENQRSDYLINEYLDIAYTTSYSLIFFLILGPWGIIPGTLDLFETIPIILHLRNGSELLPMMGIISGSKWISGMVAFGFVIRKLIPERRNTRR